MRNILPSLAASLVSAALLAAPMLAQPASAQPDIETPVPLDEALPPAYDDALLRLSEIMGALHFLRDLCGHDDAPGWRADMEALIAAEAPGPARRARLVARFNHGFETFHAVYRSCTASARRATALYLEEGERIAADVTARYGQ